MLGVNKTALILVQSFICDKKAPSQICFLYSIFTIILQTENLSCCSLKMQFCRCWSILRLSHHISKSSSNMKLLDALLSSWVEGQAESKSGGFAQIGLHKASLCVCAQTGTPSAAAKLVQVEPQPEQSPAEDLLCGWSNIKNFRSSLQPWKCCFEVSGPSHVLQTFISCAGVFFVRLFGVFLKISGKVSTN